jgi:nitrate reductase NapE component
VTLACPISKGWRAREQAPRRALHPGTAVSWLGRVFEVVAVRPTSEGGVVYSLAPWREDLAIRSLEPYDADSERERAAEHAWKASSIRNRRVALFLSPLLGHLPGAVQARMEAEFGAPATFMTAVSALPLLAIGIVGVVGFFVRMAGGSIAPLPEPSAPLSVYLFGESAMRLAVVATESRPAGSIPGFLLYEAGSAIRRALRRRS